MSLNLVYAPFPPRGASFGAYSGNGSSQSVDLGWQPALVFVCGDKSTGPSSGRAIGTQKLLTMSGTNAFRCAGSGACAFGAHGLAIDAAGFTVSTNDTNENSINYKWFAIRNGAHLTTGTYTGTGGNQTLTVGRQPASVFIFGENGTAIVKNAAMAGDLAYRIASSSVDASSGADGVEVLSTGFTAKGAWGNVNTVAYHYLTVHGLSALPSSTVHTRNGTYTGDGGSGFPPQDLTTGDPVHAAVLVGVGSALGNVVGYCGGWGASTEGYWRAAGSSTNTLAMASANTGVKPDTNRLRIIPNEFRSSGQTNYVLFLTR